MVSSVQKGVRSFYCSAGRADEISIDEDHMTKIELTSPAFENDGRMPRRFAREGGDIAPPVSWGPLPAGNEESCPHCRGHRYSLILQVALSHMDTLGRFRHPGRFTRLAGKHPRRRSHSRRRDAGLDLVPAPWMGRACSRRWRTPLRVQALRSGLPSWHRGEAGDKDSAHVRNGGPNYRTRRVGGAIREIKMTGVR